jgi:hypothetical protein
VGVVTFAAWVTARVGHSKWVVAKRWTKKMREKYVTRIAPAEYHRWMVLWKSDAPPGGAANAH